MEAVRRIITWLKSLKERIPVALTKREYQRQAAEILGTEDLEKQLLVMRDLVHIVTTPSPQLLVKWTPHQGVEVRNISGFELENRSVQEILDAARMKMANIERQQRAEQAPPQEDPGDPIEIEEVYETGTNTTV